MSTFVEIYPVESNTKRTTIIRLDDDKRITIREEVTGSPVSDIRRNYTGLETGQEITGVDPIRSVRVVKLGDDERCIITVNTYYLPDEQSTIPRAGMYWYNTKTHYDPDPILFAAKGETTTNKTAAPLSDFTLNTPNTQQFDYTTANSVSTIFNISQAVGFPTTANGVGPSFTAQRLYDRLGTVDARQRLLKGIIQETLDHEDMPIWLVRSDYDGRDSARNSIEEIANLIARPESFVIWLEMMTNAVHNVANFNSEEKFNLLHGELSLNKDDLTTKPVATYGTAQIRQNHTDVSSWSFHRFGNVGAAPTYKYSAPTATQWPAATDTRIDLSSSTLGNTWRQWIRNQI